MSKAATVRIEKILDCMLNIKLDSLATRTSNYSEILTCCKKITSFNRKTAECLVVVCTQDLTNDLKNSTSALTVLSFILNKISEEKCPSGPYLVPSAVAIVNVIKAHPNELVLRKLCLDTLNLYPDSILVTLAISYDKDFISIYDFTSLVDKKCESINKVISILTKTLKALAPDNKTLFVKEGLNTWFKSILPAVTWSGTEDPLALKLILFALEQLVDTIVTLNYESNVYWDKILGDICDPKRYPKFLKTLIDNGSDCWHRLWMILVRLLKSDITKIRIPYNISPVNALLPVVELAFRLNVDNRCRAFQCWNVLIDNFSTELSDNNVLNKRLKLLMTPMKLNNAKVEQTVLAKLNTWYHIIRRFQSKVDTLTETILVPFLHFCFGKQKGTGMAVSAPGQITSAVAYSCSEVLVEIIGHVDCDGCVTLPKLAERVINTKLLVIYWSDWLHSLDTAIKTLAISANESSKKYLCLWKGFLMTIGELPDNQIRADLFNALLDFVKRILHQNKMSLTVFKLLINLFGNETKITALLKTKGDIGPIYTILDLLCDPLMNCIYTRHKVEEQIQMLKPISDLIMDAKMTQSDEVIDWLFNKPIRSEDNKAFLWAVLADSVCESKNDIKPDNMNLMVLWPLKYCLVPNLLSNKYSEVVWYKWYTLYSYVHPAIAHLPTDNEIKILLGNIIFKPETAPFMLGASLALLKQKLVSECGSAAVEAEAEILISVLNRKNNYLHIEKATPILIDTLCLLMNKVTETKNYTLAKHCVELVKVVLNVLKTDVQNLAFIENIAKNVESLFLIEYTSLKPILESTLTECQTLLNKDTLKPIAEEDINKNNFTAPGPKVKKTKKSQPNIVSTVVENGEEYVVVKSHWKFNPRKLTENQKEKFKRKREDIPALYQDLSQSQDEFKLTTWKTDSQDASTSKSNDDVTTNTAILKTMTSTDVVPKIMENILSDTLKVTENVTDQQINANDKEKTPKVKTPKTPRMALKDRVFKNVRNLIEKSSLQEGKVNSQITEDLIQTVKENNLTTPETKPKNNNSVATNSAPPKIAIERPSRSIKKPKKFEDTEVLASKRKTRSKSIGQNGNQSDITEEVTKEQPESSQSKVLASKRKKRSKSVGQSSCGIPIELPNDQPVSSLVEVNVLEQDKRSQNVNQTVEPEKVDNDQFNSKFALKKKKRSTSIFQSNNQPEEENYSPESSQVKVIALKIDTRSQDVGQSDSQHNKPEKLDTDQSNVALKRKNRSASVFQCSSKPEEENDPPKTLQVGVIALHQDKRSERFCPSGIQADEPENLDTDQSISNLALQRKNRSSCVDRNKGKPEEEKDPPKSSQVEVNGLKEDKRSQRVSLSGSQTDEPEKVDTDQTKSNFALKRKKRRTSVFQSDSQPEEENYPSEASQVQVITLENDKRSQNVCVSDSQTDEPEKVDTDQSKSNFALKGKKRCASVFSSNSKPEEENNQPESLHVEFIALKNDKRSQNCPSDGQYNKSEKVNTDLSKSNLVLKRKRSLSGSQSNIQKEELNDQSDLLLVKVTKPLQSDGQPLKVTNDQAECLPTITSTSSEASIVEMIDFVVQPAIESDSNKNDTLININVSPVIQNDVPKVILNRIKIINPEGKQKAENNKENTKINIETTNKEVVLEHNTPKKEVSKEILDNSTQIIEKTASPKPANKKKTDDDKVRTLIAKKLKIDMVESNPLLQMQSDKRVTRSNPLAKPRNLIEKSGKIKALRSTGQKNKDVDISDVKLCQNIVLNTLTDSQDMLESQDIPTSEDVIESSQDSTITTISVKSSTKKKIPLVAMNKANPLAKSLVTNPQNFYEDLNTEILLLSDTSITSDSREDIDLPSNKTMIDENTEKDRTENMDTQPIESSSDVRIIMDDEHMPIVIDTEDTIGKDTQELADADTLPMDVDNIIPPTPGHKTNETNTTIGNKSKTDNDITNISTLVITTSSIPETAEALTDIITESSNSGSPLKDDDQRKKDFLNDTIEISPIKTMSPVKEKSPSPETSSDYVVIKFNSPVQSNGEPYDEKCDSPEIFTEEKVSPDKRDQSPPRQTVSVTNSSPSSSLSLKKNRPQMRSNGRAALMLGLCVPEQLQTLMNSERSFTEEAKKTSPVSTPARRNLRILYNTVGNSENLAHEAESEESEKFLKFKKSLPTADSSPAGPILKRKLADIIDEATVSPACKRKRVSFHDPPVSTTVSVQKYIEPFSVRSPQNSAIKRPERQMRSSHIKKSPKRLDNLFRVETDFVKTVESFTEEPTVSNDTEMSLDETPAVEIIKTSELNDTDPICPELLDCKDPIDNIAGELSSATTKTLLVKELEGKVETVGDLAKMSELEVNRLCIKAPKVKVAKKVLFDYASAINKSLCEREFKAEEVIENVIEVSVAIPEVEKINIEIQTNEVLISHAEMQTEVPLAVVYTQTDAVPTSHVSAQTIESGRQSTKDAVSTLVERPDFVDQLVEQLEQSSIERISEKMSFDSTLNLLLKKMTSSNSTEVINSVLAHNDTKVDMKTLQDFLCNRFESKELMRYCMQIMQKVLDKPA